MADGDGEPFRRPQYRSQAQLDDAMLAYSDCLADFDVRLAYAVRGFNEVSVFVDEPGGMTETDVEEITERCIESSGARSAIDVFVFDNVPSEEELRERDERTADCLRSKGYDVESPGDIDASIDPAAEVECMTQGLAVHISACLQEKGFSLDEIRSKSFDIDDQADCENGFGA